MVQLSTQASRQKLKLSFWAATIIQNQRVDEFTGPSWQTTE
ncbi:MAG: hypothetical protein ACI97A_001163 [Planctomycetota bacterium]|jgi:hypothetical protein